MLDDPAVIRGAERFVRVLVRRPHAYTFADEHPGAPIPGLAFLDAEGRLTGSFQFAGDDVRGALLRKLQP